MSQSQEGNWIQVTPKAVGNKYRDSKLLLEDSPNLPKNSTVLCEVERHGGHVWNGGGGKRLL